MAERARSTCYPSHISRSIDRRSWGAEPSPRRVADATAKEMRRRSAPAQTFRKRLDIDEGAGVAALADAALVVEGFDLKADQPSLHRDDPRGGPHRHADRGGGEVPNIDLDADRDPASFEAGLDGVGGRQLHLQDQHRRGEDQRHALDEMPDRPLRRHDQAALGADADFENFACVHGLVLKAETSSSSRPSEARAGTHNHNRPCCAKLGPPPSVAINFGGYGSLLSQGRRGAIYFFAAAARSTKVLPPFILWISGASLIWITTLSASTPRFFTSAWVMSRIMPTFCSSVRPAAMLMVISGISFSFCFLFATVHSRRKPRRMVHWLKS